jgi:hypothetical protein
MGLLATKVAALEKRVQELEGELKAFAKYRDPFNPGQLEFCGECGAPCTVVRPGKTQCDPCGHHLKKPDYSDQDYIADVRRAAGLGETGSLLEWIEEAREAWDRVREALIHAEVSVCRSVRATAGSGARRASRGIPRPRRTRSRWARAGRSVYCRVRAGS